MAIDFSHVRLPPFKHQESSSRFICGHAFSLDASEMGVGKGKSLIDAACVLFTQGVINRVVVVTPASIRRVWFEPELGELSKHLWDNIPCRVTEYHQKLRQWVNEAWELSSTAWQKTWPAKPYELGLNWIVTNYDYIRSDKRVGELMAYCGPKTLLVCDECFPTGTMVDTPTGSKKIEDIQAGDSVYNVTGIDRVLATARRKVTSGVKLIVDGEPIISSPNHPYFTNRGWVSACDLRTGDNLVRTTTSMRMVRDDLHTSERAGEPHTKVLRHLLLSELADEPTRLQRPDLYRRIQRQSQNRPEVFLGIRRPSRRSSARAEQTQRKIHKNTRDMRQDLLGLEGDGPRTDRRNTRRQWATTNESRSGITASSRSGLGLSVCSLFGTEERRVPDVLQTRRRQHVLEDRNRGRRPGAPHAQREAVRSKERRCADSTRVDRVEILEPGHPDLERFRDADGSLYFYDLSIARHPSFSVNGLLVHNSSAVKNPTAAQTKAVAKLRKMCGRVHLMNGTPVSEGAGDLFSQGNIMHPSILDCPSQTQFRARYAIMEVVRGAGGRALVSKWGKPIETVKAWRHLDDLERRFAPYVIRHLKKDCLDLPEKLPTVALPVALTPKTWSTYKDMRDEAMTWLSEGTASLSPQVTVKIMRLTQITSGFLGGVEENDIEEREALRPELGELPVFTADEMRELWYDNPLASLDFDGPPKPKIEVELSSEKLDFLVEWLKERVEENKHFKAIIWSRHRHEILRTVNRLQSQDLWMLPQNVGTLIGGQKPLDREHAIRLLDPRTCPDGPAVVVGSPGAGGKGLTLTAASCVVYMSNDWSLEKRLQSEDRVHRAGQRNVVSYFDLIATGPKGQRTVDMDVMAALARKDDLSSMTMDKWRTMLKGD